MGGWEKRLRVRRERHTYNSPNVQSRITTKPSAWRPTSQVTAAMELLLAVFMTLAINASDRWIPSVESFQIRSSPVVLANAMVSQPAFFGIPILQRKYLRRRLHLPIFLNAAVDLQSESPQHPLEATIRGASNETALETLSTSVNHEDESSSSAASKRQLPMLLLSEQSILRPPGVRSVQDVQRMSTSDLAYIGDAVYELLIRSQMVFPPKRTADLQNKVVSLVRGKLSSLSPISPLGRTAKL
jgi:hypothetical protein